MTVTTEQIEALYQANLDRASDPGGLSYYASLATGGVTLSEIDTMMRGSAEYARVNADPPAQPPPAPPPPPTGGGTGGATGTPAPSPAPAPVDSSGGATGKPAPAPAPAPAGQWVPWTTNKNVMIGGGVLAALALFGGARKR